MREQRPTVYAYPRLSKADLLLWRIGGNGLGNLMFTWARCLVQARRHGWQMIWPTWRSYKPKNKRVNPYDQRRYSDLFRPTEGYHHGIGKLYRLIRYPWIKEAEALTAPPDSSCVVEFRGMQGYFADFMAERKLVLRELLQITRNQHLSGYLSENPATIGIHIRRGDFVRQADRQSMLAVDGSRLPMSWFVAALKAVRAAAGSDVNAHVFSDGSREELAEILRLPNVQRAEFGSSIADMLALSRSRLLIGCGSTFSMWAAYMGQIPSISHPQKIYQKVLPDQPGREIEWSPGDVMPDWVEGILNSGYLPIAGD